MVRHASLPGNGGGSLSFLAHLRRSAIQRAVDRRHVQKTHPCAAGFFLHRARDGCCAALAGPPLGEGKLLMRAGKDRQSAKKLHRNSDINSLEMSHRQASETRRFLTKKGSVRFAVRRRRLRVGGYRAGRPSRGRSRFCGSQTIIGPVGRVMTPR